MLTIVGLQPYWFPSDMTHVDFNYFSSQYSVLLWTKSRHSSSPNTPQVQTLLKPFPHSVSQIQASFPFFFVRPREERTTERRRSTVASSTRRLYKDEEIIAHATYFHRCSNTSVAPFGRNKIDNGNLNRFRPTPATSEFTTIDACAQNVFNCLNKFTKIVCRKTLQKRNGNDLKRTNEKPP